MSTTQQTLMKFDPATGVSRPYPSHAVQWREYHGYGTAWLFNPWTGVRRQASDVGSDVVGYLIHPPFEQVMSASQAGFAQDAAQGLGAGGVYGGRAIGGSFNAGFSQQARQS